MNQRVVTPSKITAWLDCPHYLTLRSQVDDGQLPEPDTVFGSFSRLLQTKGELHEAACLDEYEKSGLSVDPVPGRQNRETFAAWVARVGNPLAEGHDVIYQMPFVHDGVRGIADFLERVATPDGGFAYEPVDAKLTRVEAKPGHVLQLCFYADALAALSGRDPQQMHILLGSGERETLKVNEFRPYWRRLHGQLAAALDEGPEADTVPEKCQHCAFCEFFPRCEAQWRDEDSLIFIPGIRPAERAALEIAEVTRLEHLSRVEGQPVGIRGPRLGWLVEQALDASGIEQKELAEKLGVTQGRVSQVFNGDGNMRIAAVARYLRALGYETRISATPVVPGRPGLPREPQRARARGSQQPATERRYVARLKKRSRTETPR